MLALLLSLLLVGVPAAHAAFTASTSSGFTAGALRLATPSSSTTASCSQIGSSGKYRLSITVNSVGTVPRATAYVLVVTDPTGVIYTINPATNGYSSQTAGAGTWTYFVQAQYQVSGTTNVWKSRTASPASVTC
ncbi:hypothetical protein AB0299_02705 [Pseudarthrobacter sp. NPDC080037]|uniref:hypothetical protein n=1 Tax=Pseudarthrobacter sp. NPDC080037 TaxID=3155289 RepID=UPI0034502C3D